MSAGDGITIKTDLSVRMEKVLIKKGNQAFVKVDKANIPILEEIIKKYPNFPFGYYAMAVLRQSLGYKDWRNFSNKGIEILTITTSISGHAVTHDKVLAYLKSLK